MIGNLTTAEIETVLKENTLGHLGCNDGFNTYVYPVNYLYDGKYIICHAQAGAKIKVMRQNKRVCFQVDAIENFSKWKSVMILGEYQELDDERERSYAIKALVKRMLYFKISEPGLKQNTPEQKPYSMANSKPIIYRIIIDEKSGRQENE